MNFLSRLSKEVAKMSTMEDFIVGMDFFINRMQLHPYGSMTKKQLEALYICSTETDVDDFSVYGCKNEEEYIIKNQIWKQIVHVLRENSITFNDVTKLKDKDIQYLLRSIHLEKLSWALHGTTEEIQNLFFRNMSKKMCENIKKEMKQIKNPNKQNIETAQEDIVKNLIWYSDMGIINLNKDDFITKPDHNNKWMSIEIPEKYYENFWFTFTKTGISSELREKLLLNTKKFFNSSKNQDLFKEKFIEILNLKEIADREGILSLECEIEKSDDFTKKALELLCDGADISIMDEILSTKIIQDKDINRQFIKYITMRGIMYLQSGISYNLLAQNMLALIPDEFKCFSETLCRISP